MDGCRKISNWFVEFSWGRRGSNPHWGHFKCPASADWATPPKWPGLELVSTSSLQGSRRHSGSRVTRSTVWSGSLVMVAHPRTGTGLLPDEPFGCTGVFLYPRVGSEDHGGPAHGVIGRPRADRLTSRIAVAGGGGSLLLDSLRQHARPPALARGRVYR